MDALGSVHDVQAGVDYTRDQRRFEAFGGQVAGNGPDALPLGFAASSSYQTDGDTGLMLLGNRYYDPSVGRFLSEDPSGDGDNWYAYCGNDPTGGLDPEGLSPTSAPTGASYGSPLGGLFGIAAYSSSIANGMGHWTRGKPDGYVKGQPTVAGGEINTNWISDFMSMSLFTVGNNSYQRIRSLLEHGSKNGPHVHQGGPNGPRFNRDGKEVNANGEGKKAEIGYQDDI